MSQWQPENNPMQQQPPVGPPQFGQYQQMPQYAPGPQYYAPPGYQPQPPPRKSRKGLAAVGCLGFFILGVIIIVAANAHPSSSLPASLPTLQTTLPAPLHSAAAAAKAPASAKAVTVATFTGSGEQKTATFTVSADWALSYSFDCSSNFGQSGNFAVLTDGGSDFNGVSVNDLATSKSAVTYAYNDAGTHYLEVVSECAWSLKVVNEG